MLQCSTLTKYTIAKWKKCRFFCCLCCFSENTKNVYLICWLCFWCYVDYQFFNHWFVKRSLDFSGITKKLLPIEKIFFYFYSCLQPANNWALGYWIVHRGDAIFTLPFHANMKCAVFIFISYLYFINYEFYLTALFPKVDNNRSRLVCNYW